MLLLLLSEFSAYRTVTTEERLGVDDSDVNVTVPLSFSITFPSLRCADANLDMENALGKHAIAVDAGVRHVPFVDEYVRRQDPAKYRYLSADTAPGCTVEGTVDVPKVRGCWRGATRCAARLTLAAPRAGVWRLPHRAG